MKIGITVGITKEQESMWINGIKMNAIFLANALKEAGHDVILLDTSNKIKGSYKDKVVWDFDKFPIFRYLEKAKNLDVLILLGTTLLPQDISNYRILNPKAKIIKYMCGNNYVIDMERSLFKGESEAITTYQNNIDELWYVPQQGFQNHEYYRVLHKLPKDKVFPVPFIWDPMFIDDSCEFYGKVADMASEIENNSEIADKLIAPVYWPKKPKDKKLVIMEPNMNIVKFSMIPLLIAEEAFRNGAEFGELNIISGDRISKNHYYSSIVENLDVFKAAKDSKIKMNWVGRYPVHRILAQFGDVIISHQWQNPLNYAYLDALYLQFPLIHNAQMIQDAGYYYNDFDISEGTHVLEACLKEHDSHIDEYNAASEEVLTRYTVFNEGLVSTYNKLLENLVAGENKHNLSHRYNWKTNTYR